MVTIHPEKEIIMKRALITSAAVLGLIAGGSFGSVAVAGAETPSSQTVEVTQTAGGSIYDRVIGTAASYAECEAKLARYVIKYGKVGICVPDPKLRGTWLFLTNW